MSLARINTPNAPAAIGPYSQAIVVEGMVYSAGQIPLDPDSMEIVDGGVGDQTRQVMRNLRAVLTAAGTDLQHVVKTTVYLVDMADFGEMNAAYAEAFGEHKPARSTVAVAGLPKGVRVEIDVVARIRS